MLCLPSRYRCHTSPRHSAHTPEPPTAAQASPVVLALDAGVIGVSAVLALQALASLIIRLDAAPAATASEAGYLGGDMVVTELLAVRRPGGVV